MRDPKLRSHAAVQPRRDDVQRVFDECPFDRRTAAIAHVNAHAGTEVHRRRLSLREDVLEVDVTDHVAERYPPDANRVVSGRIDHDALETLLEAGSRLRTDTTSAPAASAFSHSVAAASPAPTIVTVAA